MAYKNILMIGLSIVLIGLIGYTVVHMVDWLVYTLWLVMANPIHTLLLCLLAIGTIFSLPSKK